MIASLVVLALTGLVWVALARWLVRAGRARPDPSERFDAVVVLGCRVGADGAPGPAFARRIELGCELLRAGAAPTLVITGGKVGGPVTEAASARAYIEARSLAPLERVRLEDRATSTRTNATCTRALLGDGSVLVVTTDWHVPRSRRIFARSFSRVKCAGAPGKLRGALREVPLWILALAQSPWSTLIASSCIW